MSAPPIGKVTPTPKRVEAITKSQIELIFPLIRYMKATNEVTPKTMFTKCLALT